MATYITQLTKPPLANDYERALRDQLENSDWKPSRSGNGGVVNSILSKDGPVYSASFPNVGQLVQFLDALPERGITKGTHASRIIHGTGTITISKGELNRLGINPPEPERGYTL